MNLFDKLGAGPQPQMMNQQQLLQQLQANPAAMLKQRGLNIPCGMNNPQQIVNHLVQSGQIPQGRLQSVMAMAQQMGLPIR